LICHFCKEESGEPVGAVEIEHNYSDLSFCSGGCYDEWAEELAYARAEQNDLDRERAVDFNKASKWGL
jgi:hypothetical protein